MAYFLPYGFQKRILRYALSQLELLDTEALDLDKLGISWGRTSGISLKDIEIRKERLASLLQLPEEVVITRARVSDLVLTVPADLYRSGIGIVVDGVEIEVNIGRDGERKDGSQDGPGAEASEDSQKPKSRLYRSSRASPKERQTAPLMPGHFDSDLEDDFETSRHSEEAHIPSTDELAQSYLAAEPPEKRSELEHTLGQSQLLGVSSTSEGSLSDDPNLGFGSPLSLPSFLADFLKGVAARLSVQVQNVTIDFIVASGHKASSSPGYNSSHAANETTLRCLLAHVRLPEVLDNATLPAVFTGTENHRQLELHTIRVLVNSEASDIWSSEQTESPNSPGEPRATTSLKHSGRMSNQKRANLGQSEKSGTKADGMESLESPRSPIRGSNDSSDEDCQVSPSKAGLNERKLEMSLQSVDSRAMDKGKDSGRSREMHKDSDSESDKNESSGSNSQASPQDLGESTIFSHEQATSMYLSAMSIDNSSDVRVSQRFRPQKPSGEKFATPEHSRPELRTVPDSSMMPQTLSESLQKTSTTDTDTSSTASSLYESAPGGISPSTTRRSREDQSPRTILRDHQTKWQRRFETSTGWRQVLKVDTISIDIPIDQTDSPTREGQEDSSRPSSGDDKSKQASSNERSGWGSEPPHTTSQSYNLKLGVVEAVADINLVMSGVTILQRLANLGSSPAPRKSSKHSTSTSSLGVSIQRVDWKLLDAVRALGFSPRNSQGFEKGQMSLLAEPSTLFQSTAEGLHVELRHDKTGGSLIGSVQTFVFGFDNQDILSFGSASTDTDLRKMPNVSDRKDFTLEVSRQSRSLSVNIATQPLHVVLDLQRLDETLAWFGGLSGLLDLSNSIASNFSFVEKRKRPTSTMTKARGVRFESNDGQTDTPTKASQNASRKITARLGGLSVHVLGTTCHLRAESTAIKAVSRAEGLGLQVDRINIQGPYSNEASLKCLHNVDLTNLRVEYLQTPKEVDLERLLALLSHSQRPNDRDDDILVDTLLRQRNKGAVMRATVNSAEISIDGKRDLNMFSELGEDLKKLSTVAKYLPEDDRPGILTLSLVRSLKARIYVDERIGTLEAMGTDIECAHVTFPTLVTFSVGNLGMSREAAQDLMGSAVPLTGNDHNARPVVSLRFIGNEMDPKVTVILRNFRLEYHTDFLTAIMNLEDSSLASGVSDLANSVATLTDAVQSHDVATAGSGLNRGGVQKGASSTLPIGIEVHVLDSFIGLNPRASSAKAYLVLNSAQLETFPPEKIRNSGKLEIGKATLLLIDEEASDEIPSSSSDHHTAFLEAKGFAVISRLSALQIKLAVLRSEDFADPALELDVLNGLLVLETCADSTQTLSQVLNGLSPPSRKSDKPKYKTEVVPIQDMLASFTGEPVQLADTTDSLDEDYGEADMMEDDVPQNLDFVASFYNPDPDQLTDSVADSMLDGDLESLAAPPTQRKIGDRPILESFNEQVEVAQGDLPLDIQNDYFGGADGKPGKSAPAPRPKPLTIRVREGHIIWNLYDGYDWQRTREVINEAAAEVEKQATERLARREKRQTFGSEAEPEEDVIGDFLFNSIYIGIPAKSDPAELMRHINADIDDMTTETASTITSGAVRSSNRPQPPKQSKRRGLRLKRSKHHKMAFELKGIAVDLLVSAPGDGEVECDVSLRVRDMEIFDLVPTSTWKKFATYMHDAGERESDSSMVHLRVQIVRPVPTLSATEIRIKLSVLPLRLHVDQDALEFLSRFFEFKDPSTTAEASASEPPFIQRTEVNAIRVRLDFKPKRVDYAGIRSGRTNEFMNFFVLDGANMVLRHVIIYGVSGLDRLGKTLNDIWMPDVKHNQLPSVLAGLAPVRSLVNMTGGVRDLVAVPIREYRKDGRVVRSFQKGAVAFAKTTTSELARLGAKMAIGTQTVLQGAEDILSTQFPQPQQEALSSWEEGEFEEEKGKKVSLYADQPVGVIQGLRGGYASLERDLLTAKDAIVAMPGEILESGSAGEVARAVWKGAPTVILRPAMGVSKVVGQTLMGATNSLDPANRRRIEEKYKRH